MRDRLKQLIGVIISIAAVCGFSGSASADLQGVDVSSWQPATICGQISADFCVVKATEGIAYTNTSMRSQVTSAINSGKHSGVYHYADGGNPIAEADYYVNTVAAYIGSSMLVLDWESGGNAAWGNGNWIRQWVDRVHARSGVWPVVYVQRSAVWQVPSDVRANCGLWVAQYASMAVTGYQPEPWRYGASGEMMLQYSSSGSISGYYPLDLDIFAGDGAAWQKYANPQNPTSVKPLPNLRPSNPAPAAPTPSGCVTVAAGDSLSAIAARLGTTWQSLTGYRSGNPNIIYVGETICTSGASTSPAPQSTVGTYTVRSGDTLSAIATRHGTTWQSLAQTNEISNPNIIYVGQVIRIGVGVSQSYNNSGVYIVRSGDTLSGIAARHGTTWQQLAQINGISNPNIIYTGQRINI